MDKIAKDIYGPDEGWSNWYDYDPMLRSFGKIVVQIDEGGYQGDSYVLYYEFPKVGYLQFGWGSCSGCDALQACSTLEEVDQLMSELRDSIQWFDDRAAALKFFQEHDWEGDYTWHVEEHKRFIAAAKGWLGDAA